ncbi:hypothetical protein NBO_32g0021 [Nosema bombycis CQ1]|uniref:Uncharacterized protein n=1 Tax=Nosema bombycis (strain CQ1 / CVCC 102059) TaxID=578461 RepID=R0KTV7_NOSB1|nr:hypothetical protein NBO_32g0021 [Nosema bombycis CQ1]|eukprot:EOB14246.1 hypothetical protein NBO_32g0021 [Nosema bombycis CQ1]
MLISIFLLDIFSTKKTKKKEEPRVINIKPPILNYSDYVIAYSVREKYKDIEKWMGENNLTFIGVPIEKTSPVAWYFWQMYKNSKTRVFYFGKDLGPFLRFKKEYEIQKKLKSKKEIRDEQRKGTVKVKIRNLVHDDVFIYTNSKEFANEKNN